MKSIIATLSLFLAGTLAHAQTNTRTVSSFTKIEVSGNIEMVYTETAAPSIKVNTENDPEVITQINEGILKISLKNKTTETMKVYVTGNNLSAIKAEEKASIVVKNQLSAAEFNLTLLSGSHFAGNIRSAQKVILQADNDALFVGRIDTEMLVAKLGSNAKASISGIVYSAQLNTSGHAFCHAGNLLSEHLVINAQNVSIVKAYAQATIDISVSGKAKAMYSGKPAKVTMNKDAIAFDGKSDMPIAVN